MQRRAAILALGFLALGCGASSAAPTSPAKAEGTLGVLLMAHGGSAEWNAAVLECVKPLRASYDIEVVFGMADAATLQEGVRKLEERNARRIAVVRLFVSGESFLVETEQILGLRPMPATPAPAAHQHQGGGHAMAFFKLKTQSSFAISAPGLADAEGMGIVLADRARSLSKNPATEDVLVLAHGPGDDGENARWLAKLEVRSSVIRASVPFRRVQVETLREDWPEKRADAEKRIRAFVTRAKVENGTAIVIPFRVQGFGPYAKVLEGLDYVADSRGLIPHSEVTKWIAAQIASLERGPFRPPG